MTIEEYEVQAATKFPSAIELDIPLLYRYQPFHEERLSTLICDKKIRFSNPASFNDPWDCKPWFDISTVDDPAEIERLIEYYVDITKRRRPDISDDAIAANSQRLRVDSDYRRAKVIESSVGIGQGIDEQYRVYCLAEKFDCELMWAHYAASHSGVVIAYRTDNPLFCSALRVRYAEKYPAFSLASKSPDDTIGPLLTKSAAWRYEQEFRLVAQEKAFASGKDTLCADSHFVSRPSRSIESITLGCLASDATISKVQKLVAASGEKITLRRAHRALDRYQLVFKNLDD